MSNKTTYSYSILPKKLMTENEKTLIETIRNHPNPEQAMIKAVEIIIAHLKKNEEVQKVGA